MPERVLTPVDLNRALLARQLLLERSRLPLTRAIERVGGLQTQYAPSGYIALWSRLERFARDDLTRALERRQVIQGTLIRSTIHMVSANDYPLFAVGSRRSRQQWWLRVHRKELGSIEMEPIASIVRQALEAGPLRRDALVELLRPHDPTGRPAVWNGVGAWIDLVRVPPAGTWERRRADLYATADDWVGPSTVEEAEALELLLRRYLGGFGPAPLADAATWAGVPTESLRPAAERLRLRRFRDEEGRELLDLPRAPLPGGDAPAPVRFLPTWEAMLLVHARRTLVVPEEIRPLIFNTKTPQSVATFLVDGAVAGTWRWERTARQATLAVEPFDSIPRAARSNLDDEAARLVRFLEPDAPAHAVRVTRR